MLLDFDRDWLSQQYEEEEKSLQEMNKLFNFQLESSKIRAAHKLKLEHLKKCDADTVIKEHTREDCGEGKIDLGSGRTVDADRIRQTKERLKKKYKI